MLTDTQREWLDANRLPRDRWLAGENSMPFIDELVDAGLMQPAYGEFVMKPSSGETMSVLGKTLPVETMVSLYMLTPRGRNALQEGGTGL